MLYIEVTTMLNESMVKTWLPGYNISFFDSKPKLVFFFPLPELHTCYLLVYLKGQLILSCLGIRIRVATNSILSLLIL